MRGDADTFEGREALHRDLNKTECLAITNPMTFNKDSAAAMGKPWRYTQTGE